MTAVDYQRLQRTINRTTKDLIRLKIYHGKNMKLTVFEDTR
jgi:hypothetical protein